MDQAAFLSYDQTEFDFIEHRVFASGEVIDFIDWNPFPRVSLPLFSPFIYNNNIFTYLQ